MSTLRILFIGDIVGAIGRRAVAELLPGLKEEIKPDLVIANGENAAHGKGITPATAEELRAAGIDWLTTGDHCFDQAASVPVCFDESQPILRPANYAAEAPGRGFAVISTPQGEVLLINLIGRVFMAKNYEDPFRKSTEILESFTDKKFSAIIIDMHAEATSEKIALRHFLDGRITALIGTHTHVQTADNQVTAAGTGFLSDAGMTGFADGVIGLEAAPIVASYLTQTKQPHVIPEEGRAIFSAALVTIDTASGHCLSLEPLQRFLDI